jgi:hypothetical protein
MASIRSSIVMTTFACRAEEASLGNRKRAATSAVAARFRNDQAFWGRLLAELKTGLGTAEFDILHHIHIAILAGIHTGGVEFLVGGFHLHGRCELFGGIDESEDGLIALHLQRVLSGLQFEVPNFGGGRKGQFVVFGDGNGQSAQR